jgi:hypothetical protein
VTRLFRHVAITTIAVAALASTGLAQSNSTAGLKPPAVPADLQVSSDNTLFLSGEARGTQNYICLPTASGFAWTFFSPQATLFLTFKSPFGEFRQQIITHFLSPNPVEGGTGRATWQSSIDSSAVWAKTVDSSTDQNFVAAGAIPWLKLQAVGTVRGPEGGDVLAHTSFVQRLNTAGGVAPATGCSLESNVGATALVPYTADYFFYRANSQK